MVALVKEPGKIDAVVFDFSDVVARIRTAFAGESGSSPYHVDMEPDVVQGIKRLKAIGIKTALITNNDRLTFEHHAPYVPLKDLFDVDVFSSDLDINKPDGRIFRHTLKALDTEPQRSIFLDDIARNVDGAIAIGMQGVVVDRPATAVRAIDEILAAH